MLTKSLSKAAALLNAANYYPVGMITGFAEKAQEDVRAMFIALFDKKREVYERIDAFKRKSNFLLERYGNGAVQHYQHENAICTYLWLRYHDKYYIYKLNEIKAISNKLESSYTFKKGDYANNIRNFLDFYNEETKQALDEEKLYLGGCCVCGIEPEFHCFDCKKDFGTPPVFVCKNETEKYRDIIVSISFYDGGYFEGYPEVFMEKRIDSIMVSVYAGHRKEPVFQRTMSENEWFMIIDQLYETLYIHEWEEKYNNPDILDGEQWGVWIKLTENREKRYCGNNAYPALWMELKELFRTYFNEASVRLCATIISE